MLTEANGIVTLTTDLGTTEGYVAAIKGAILRVHPRAQLVDVTHHIRTADITEAAFQIATVCTAFPPGTVHLLVVASSDLAAHPPVAAAVGDQYFVAPNHGVLTLVAANVAPSQVRLLDRSELFHDRTGSTFPGRDVYAPIAGHLAAGEVAFDALGSELAPDDLLRLPWAATRDSEHRVHAPIVSVDRFGNCRTLITRAHVPWDLQRVYVRCGDVTVRGIVNAYTDVPEGRTLALFGSHGGLEIAVRGRSAAQSWELARGDDVCVFIGEEPRG